MTTPVRADSSAGIRRYACPACEGAPELEVFRRHELLTAEPLRFCPRCHGFWAAGDSLALGVTDPSSAYHPAVLATRAPRRCRACLGHLDADEVCRKCGTKLPRYACPSCGVQMDRRTGGGVVLDACAPCRGTWFDVGEIIAVYDLSPAPSPIAMLSGEAEPVEERDLIMTALSLVARLFLPL